MNRPRVTVSSEAEEASYHCMSRTAGRVYLFKDFEKELICKQIWLVSEYCGLHVVTYVVMDNHYHVLVRVPIRKEVGDQELLRLYGLLYPKLKPQQQKALDKVIEQMPQNGPLAVEWREQQKRQMFDVSHFNKLLKMRISIWFNQKHKRKGTLWEAPFKSVLVGDGDALETTAAYIDLNPIRAGIVSDPKDYRFCGYAAAMVGVRKAREGLESIYLAEWKEIAGKYRCLLYGTASGPMEAKAKISLAEFHEVVRSQGELPLSTVLRYRVRYLVDGAILGSHSYVAAQTAKFLAGKSFARKRVPQDLLAVTNWKGLKVYSRMRSSLFA